MDRRPPLAVSPRRLRPRRVLRPIQPPDQTPPPATSKSLFISRSANFKETPPSPGYQFTSKEFVNLTKKVDNELLVSSNDPLKLLDSPSYFTNPLFERGKFYDLYSARRNERLKRKQWAFTEEALAGESSIAVELAKRRTTAKKAEVMRKSVPASFSVSRASSLRSSVRNSKEMKKPAASGATSRSVADAVKRNSARSVRRI